MSAIVSGYVRYLIRPRIIRRLWLRRAMKVKTQQSVFF